MTKEDKNLLLKDLCARLPYEVIVQDRNGTHVLMPGNTELGTEYIKPYLRPMSSMTEEEEKQFFKLKQMSVTVVVPNVNRLEIEYIVDLEDDGDGLNHLYDWLNAHYFDHRGLISMGLALEAPEGMYKTE